MSAFSQYQNVSRVTMVALALLLSLAIISSAFADATAGCTAGSGGSCQTLETDCDRDHPGNELDVCISKGGCTEVPSPDSCLAMLQNGQGSSVSRPIPRPQNVTLELASTNLHCFSVQIRWELPANSNGALKGFQVESQSATPLKQCACLSDPDVREFTFHGLKYGTTQFQSLNLKVRSLPYTSEEDAVAITHPEYVPTSCRDLPYEPCHCIPPRYQSVRNIQFTTTLVSGDPNKMRIHLTWEHPNTPQPFPDPSVYYIQVIQVTDPRVSIIPIMYFFKVEGTLSVTLPPLNASRSYYVTIQPYVRCAGVDVLGRNNGCGWKANVEVSYRYTLPSPSTPVAVAMSSSSTSISVESCPDAVLETHDHNFGICTAANPATSTAPLVSQSPTVGTPESPTIDTTSSPVVETQESPSSPTIRVPESFATDISPTNSPPEAGITSTPEADTTSAPEAGTTIAPEAGTTIAPEDGTTIAPEAGTTVAVGFIVAAVLVSTIVIISCTIFVITVVYYCARKKEPKEFEAVGFSCPFSLKQDLPPPSTAIAIKLQTVPRTSTACLPAQPLQTASRHDYHSTESFPTPSTHPSTQLSPTPSTHPSTQLSPTPSTYPSTQLSPTSSTHASTQLSPTPSTHPPTQTSPTPSTHPSTQTSPTPSTPSSTQLSLTPSTQTSLTPSTSHPVLLIYSQDSPEREIRVLLQLLVKGLSQYDIDVTHNSGVQRGSLPEWLAEEFQRAVAVLVVCNEQLHQQWNHQGRGSVIAALKHMIHVSVGKQDFSKIAVVLLKAGDDKFIPTPYLEDTRTFVVNRVHDIAYFVKDMSPYTLNHNQ